MRKKWNCSSLRLFNCRVRPLLLVNPLSWKTASPSLFLLLLPLFLVQQRHVLTSLRCPFGEKVSPQLIQLAFICCHMDPSQRPTITILLHDLRITLKVLEELATTTTMSKSAGSSSAAAVCQASTPELHSLPFEIAMFDAALSKPLSHVREQQQPLTNQEQNQRQTTNQRQQHESLLVQKQVSTSDNSNPFFPSSLLTPSPSSFSSSLSSSR